MYDINTRIYSGLGMTAELVEDIRIGYVGYAIRKEAFEDWKALPWWKRMFARKPYFEGYRPLFLSDDD